MLVIGVLLIRGPRMGAPDHHHGVMLGAAAGILFGVSDVAIKALTGIVGDGLSASSSALARRRGPGLGRRLLRVGPRPAGRRGRPGHRLHLDRRQRLLHPGGIIVFGDPMPGDTLGIACRSSPSRSSSSPRCVTPPPMRAAEANAASLALRPCQQTPAIRSGSSHVGTWPQPGSVRWRA